MTLVTTSKARRWAPVDTGLPSGDSALGVALAERLALDPALERLLGVPAGVDEVAVLALDRAQQLELLEARHLLDGAGPGGEAGLELGAGARRARRWR